MFPSRGPQQATPFDSNRLPLALVTLLQARPSYGTFLCLTGEIDNNNLA